jgi:hypothetical protein
MQYGGSYAEFLGLYLTAHQGFCRDGDCLILPTAAGASDEISWRVRSARGVARGDYAGRTWDGGQAASRRCGSTA